MTESVAQQTMGTSPQHEITRISDTLNNLEESAKALKTKANSYKQQLQAGTGESTANASGLSETEDIDNNVQEIVKLVRETREALEGERKDVCPAKEKDINTEIDGRERLGCLPMQCVSTSSEEQYDGYVEIVSKCPMTVTCYQHFHVEIAHTYKCEIDINDLTVSTKMTPSSKQSAEDTSPFTRIVKTQGKYFIEGVSSSDLTLHVKFRQFSIKGSPIKIIVEPVGIVRSISNVGQSTGIMGNAGIQDLVMSENGGFLIACNKREVFQFGNSGAFISKIQMGQSLFSQINRICKIKNNLICCDWGMSRITYFEHNSKEITSTSTGLAFRSLPFGVSVDEDLNVAYVADSIANCVRVYELENNLTKSKTFGCYGGLGGQMNRPSDVAVTKEGNIIVADTHNHRVQLFGSDGKFIKVLIGGGDKDGMVIKPNRLRVDNDDNIIVVSECKVQLFDKHGKFLTVIHETDKSENKNFVISIVSHYPRRLAIAKVNSIIINVFNY